MDCAKARDLLQFYLDNTLDPQEALDLEAHLGGCSGCRTELVQMERLMLSIESLPRFVAPPSMLAATMAGIQRPLPLRKRILQWSANGAGVLFLLAGLLLAILSADDAIVA